MPNQTIPSRWVLPAMALAGSLALPALARAEIRPLYTSGLWSAYGGTAENQRAVCGISTAGAEGRRIAIQQFTGDKNLDVVLEKPSWSIPDNTPVEVVVQVDGYSTRLERVTGTGTRVYAHLPFDASIPFMRAVRAGQQIRVGFPNGTEAVWTGGLRGSSAVINAFNECRAAFTPATRTQPFSSDPATRPIAPTQPFAPQPPASTTPNAAPSRS